MFKGMINLTDIKTSLLSNGIIISKNQKQLHISVKSKNNRTYKLLFTNKITCKKWYEVINHIVVNSRTRSTVKL